MAAKRDYYEVLGLPRAADEAEIKRAFRRLARDFHPDVYPDDPVAEAKFKELAEAYEVLSDADSRAAYDHYGFDGLKGRPMVDFAQFGFADLFNAFFGGGMFGDVLRRQAAFGDVLRQAAGGGAWGAAGRLTEPGADVGVEVEVTLAEAAAGVTRVVPVIAEVHCDRCGGTGANKGTSRRTCPQCGGSGQIRQVSSMGGFGQFIRTGPCAACGGRGAVVKEPCDKCHGAGRFTATREVSIDIPPGIAHGQRIRISSEGGVPGPSGGHPGDLYVAVRVLPDERFMREGNDLIHHLHVTIVQAALGDSVTVPALDGDIQLSLPAGTQPGDVKLFRGRGMPALRGRGRGSLKVIVQVTVPRHLSAEQRELLERFQELCSEKNYEPGDGFFDRVRAAFRP